MKTLLLALTLSLSATAFSETGIPNLNCHGTVDGNSTPLQYRDGAAAFMNVYLGEVSDTTFIVVLNKANPVKDNEILPVTMIIGNTKSGKTLKQKDAIMAVDSAELKMSAKSEDGKIAKLSCIRLLNNN